MPAEPPPPPRASADVSTVRSGKAPSCRGVDEADEVLAKPIIQRECLAADPLKAGLRLDAMEAEA